MATLEIGLSFVDPRRLRELEVVATLDVAALGRLTGEAAATAVLPDAAARVTHLYVGSEFCEHLFPAADDIERALAVADRHGLTAVLATPIANDPLVERIVDTASQLPPAAEILVNDWGVAAALRAAQPGRSIVVGRQLARMIKDPRAPSPWMRPYAPGYGSAPFRRILDGLGIRHLELDVPPFATAETWCVPDMGVTLWVPYGYAAKGRICKIGSLRRPAEEKFAPGTPCNRECLGIVEAGIEPSATGIMSDIRGNSIYYRHDANMVGAARAALAKGYVSRIVLASE
jgi:hypothetical protein